MKISIKSFENKDPDSSVKAYASMTVDDAIIVKNLAVVNGKNGLFVNMPHHKSNVTGKDGKPVYKDDVFPVTKELRDKINEAAIESYENGGKIVGFECDPKAMQKANPWHTAKEGPEEKPSVLRYLQEESKAEGSERQIKLSMAPRTDMER